MKALDHYFEAAMGMYIGGEGRCARAQTRLKPCPPFSVPFWAAELCKGGEKYRSLSPDAPADAEIRPLEDFDKRLTVYNVLTVSEAWTPCVEPCAIPLDSAYPICGAARLPDAGRGWGILRGGMFVGWACASPAGTVWNVSVETAPAHRRQGIAADCLTALTSDLLRAGCVPMYLCETGNIASCNTALAAGYVRYGIWRRVIAA